MGKLDLHLKRAYDTPSKDDGFRVLVDGLWPRGLSKQDAAVDEWLRKIAPSSELRKWFGHRVERWDEFKRRYKHELEQDDRSAMVAALRQHCRRGRVTLVFAATDQLHNNAVVLKELLCGS